MKKWNLKKNTLLIAFLLLYFQLFLFLTKQNGINKIRRRKKRNYVM